MALNTSAHGIILFAHGSRDALWRLPIEAVAKQIRTQSPNTVVDCAYLELTAPDLASSVASMIDKGIHDITIVPMFLGVGKHAREDLPELVLQMQKAHPHMVFNLRRAIGEEPQMTQMMATIALQSIG